MKKSIYIVMLTFFLMLIFTVDTFAEETIQKDSLPVPKYQIKETIVQIQRNSGNIVGTWAIPEHIDGKYPAVILFHGFAGNRNEFGNMFKTMATTLAQQGVATLRIDFTGSGESDGKWEDTTLSSQILDAETTLQYVLKQPDVDIKRVGLLGLSQGGLVAACTAGRNSGVIKSVELWSPAAIPATAYAAILGNDTIDKALHSKGQTIDVTLPWGAAIKLKTAFFEEIYTIDPIAEMYPYTGSLEVSVGLKDQFIYPQPAVGELFLKYHNSKAGTKKQLIMVDAGHLLGAESEDKKEFFHAVTKTLEWFNETL